MISQEDVLYMIVTEVVQKPRAPVIAFQTKPIGLSSPRPGRRQSASEATERSTEGNRQNARSQVQSDHASGHS
jgi:hypothetical protein